MSRRFKKRKPVKLTGEAFKRPTPRDCRHLRVPQDEAERWEVMERRADGTATGMREKKPSLPVLKGDDHG